MPAPRSSPRSPRPAAKSSTAAHSFGGDLGGPIVPGVLHFFGAYEGTRQTSPAKIVNPSALLPGTIRDRFGGNFAADFKQDLYFAKLTLFASDRDTISGSYFLRKETDVKDYGDNRAFEQGRDVGTESKNYQLEWAHRGDGFLNELTFSYFNNFTGTPTITTGPEYVLTNGVGGGDLFFFGANSFQQANEQESFTFKNNFTYTGWENHVVKAGVKISMNTLTRVEDAFANGSYKFAYQNFTSESSSIPYRATISLLPPTPMEADNVQVGLFLQDDWTIDDHWTVNLGLRWDYESNNFNNNYHTPEKVATALRNYQPWQPRVGISYDVNGDRDLVFFAVPAATMTATSTTSPHWRTLFNNIRSDASVNFCGASGLPACAPGLLQWSEAYRNPDALRAAVAQTGLSGDIWVINNDAKVPYTDQFTLGVRKRLGPVQLSAAVAHNRSHNAFIFVRGNRQTNGNYTDGGFGWVRDNFPAGNGLVPGYTGRLNIGSSEGKAKYTALYLTADKTYTKDSGWGATASLTISDAKSNQAISFDEGRCSTRASRMRSAGSRPATSNAGASSRPAWATCPGVSRSRAR
ncbi:tonB dependent receptor domain-containing protein [Ditylenchus destructor]|uniref:TonB dependent receptor domain-containing protein n=1 Tax=Ditylenchus destructor TaxID=166010 RepID=A0AAD4MI84_9BILA|nr:tonB dependent receptor domain-containing protein [Ditylenchus destructor]